MQYCGGKFRVRKQISNIINQYTKNRPFVSLFCGSCWVESLVKAPLRICNDANYYLIEMWKAFQRGEDFYSYLLPEINDEDYLNIKENQDVNPPLTALIGFGCSYGGKWFGGYAKNKRGDNYFASSLNSCLSKIKTMQNVKFIYGDFQAVRIPENSVVFCDSPYNGTISAWGTQRFEYETFYNYVRKLSKEHLVFISEYSLPSDFKCIWSDMISCSMKNNDNNNKRKEKLFVHEDRYEEVINSINNSIR